MAAELVTMPVRRSSLNATRLLLTEPHPSRTPRLMPSITSTRTRQALAVLAAAAVVIGCSSDSMTSPTTRDNAALILHFDSLRNSSFGNKAIIYYDVVELLVEGAPVGTGTITVNGVPRRMNIIAERTLEVTNGVPWDSAYSVIAWQGDGADTAIAFVQTAALNTFAAFGEASSHSVGGTVAIAPGALGATCTPFSAPGDIDLIPPLECHLQRATAAFSADLSGGDGPTVAVPQQSVSGIGTEIGTPPC